MLKIVKMMKIVEAVSKMVFTKIRCIKQENGKEKQRESEKEFKRITSNNIRLGTLITLKCQIVTYT